MAAEEPLVKSSTMQRNGMLEAIHAVLALASIGTDRQIRRGTAFLRVADRALTTSVSVILTPGRHIFRRLHIADEKQLIKLFLESEVDTAAFTCADMNTLFFPCGQNKIQKIFDQLPGVQLSD